jgi:hypothetical protein
VSERSAIAIYEFKYRSRAALQSIGSIPRSPSPTPLEERPEDNMTVEELREFFRRHRENQPPGQPTNIKQEKIKRERSRSVVTDVMADGDRVELVAHRRKRARASTANEVIELSDDDD